MTKKNNRLVNDKESESSEEEQNLIEINEHNKIRYNKDGENTNDKGSELSEEEQNLIEINGHNKIIHNKDGENTNDKGSELSEEEQNLIETSGFENDNLHRSYEKLKNQCMEISNYCKRLKYGKEKLISDNNYLIEENKKLINYCEKLGRENKKLENEYDQAIKENRQLLEKMASFNIDVGIIYGHTGKYPVTQIRDDFTKIRNEWDIFLDENSNITKREFEIEAEKFFGEIAIKLLYAIKHNLKTETKHIMCCKEGDDKPKLSENCLNNRYKQPNKSSVANDFSKKQLDQNSIIKDIETSILETKYLSCSQESINYEIDKIIEHVKTLLNKCYNSGIDIDFIVPNPEDPFNGNKHEIFGSFSNEKTSIGDKKIIFCTFPGIMSITSRPTSKEKSEICQVKALVYI